MALIREDKVGELAKSIDEASLEASMSFSLADAIEEGSTVTGQCIGNWTSEDGENTCAMSAALLSLKAHRMVE